MAPNTRRQVGWTQSAPTSSQIALRFYRKQSKHNCSSSPDILIACKLACSGPRVKGEFVVVAHTHQRQGYTGLGSTHSFSLTLRHRRTRHCMPIQTHRRLTRESCNGRLHNHKHRLGSNSFYCMDCSPATLEQALGGLDERECLK